ncbi:Alpha/Beta hydrolase protein [Stachybotrys elegans]|uniref:Alpha/Beta hydrolase protein n=1 Tax=Stachybotrys elegans TaxID=80388 RepID=A0A8K0WUS8_9HYPO|nr:Alpha/Beta hydrolase protein [Stachybotrys elegans]
MSDQDTSQAPQTTAQEPAVTEQHTGEHCVTDRPTPTGQKGTGETIKLNDVDAYISKPADFPHTPCRVLLLLTGGTGIKSTNNQIQADNYASEGFLVVMPDMFGGDMPFAPSITDDSASLLERVKMKAVEITKAFVIDMWLARVTEEKVMPILHKVIDAIHDQYADVVKSGGGIYAVGYCVGGRFVLLLGKETQQRGSDEESAPVKKGPYIKAGAVAHGASVTPDDFKDIKVPLSLVCVENDSLFPDEVRTAGEDTMSAADLEHEVQVYPGVPHGFAVVGEYADPHIKDAQSAAYQQMLSWIQTH